MKASVRITFIVAILALIGGVTASAVPSHSGANRFCADMATGNVHIAVMGDSIMTDAGASSPDRGWPQQLKAYTAARNWNVTIDVARAGSKASDFAAGGQYYNVTQSVAAMNPSLVTLNWRTNEQWANVDPDVMRGHYLNIIDTIRASSPTTSFIIVSPPRMTLDANGYDIDDYTTWNQSQYIVKMWDVKIWRDTMWLDFAPWFPRSGTYARELLPDNIHPSNYGHTIMVSSFFNVLNSSCN